MIRLRNSLLTKNFGYLYFGQKLSSISGKLTLLSLFKNSFVTEKSIFSTFYNHHHYWRQQLQAFEISAKLLPKLRLFEFFVSNVKSTKRFAFLKLLNRFFKAKINIWLKKRSITLRSSSLRLISPAQSENILLTFVGIRPLTKLYLLMCRDISESAFSFCMFGISTSEIT